MKIVWEARIRGLHGCVVEGDIEGYDPSTNVDITRLIRLHLEQNIKIKYQVVDDDPKKD